MDLVRCRDVVAGHDPPKQRTSAYQIRKQAFFQRVCVLQTAPVDAEVGPVGSELRAQCQISLDRQAIDADRRYCRNLRADAVGDIDQRFKCDFRLIGRKACIGTDGIDPRLKGSDDFIIRLAEM